MTRRSLFPFIFCGANSAAENEYIRIEATVEKCRVRGQVIGAREGIRLLIYAKTDSYYIQPCIAEPQHSLRRDGQFGPIDTHTGQIFVLIAGAGYRPRPVLSRLPAVDAKNIFAVAGPFGSATDVCDVARCPAI